MTKKNKGKTPSIVGITGLLFLYLGFLVAAWLYDSGIAGENMLMENLQAGALGLCFLLEIGGLVTGNTGEQRFIRGGLALLFLGLFLREVDVERMNLPYLVIAAGSGAGRALLLVIPGLLLIAIFMKKHRELMPWIVDYVKSPVFRLMILGVFFYSLSYIFDKHFFNLSGSFNLFMEELVENAATFFFLIGSILAFFQAAPNRK